MKSDCKTFLLFIIEYINFTTDSKEIGNVVWVTIFSTSGVYVRRKLIKAVPISFFFF